jgi:LysR family transcriptional regulator, glycine cleavage system transcriptional activator
MKLPSLNAIRAFEAAARLQSFKEAASELNLTPSAVSRHIRSLEDDLGIELFQRCFRQVELTAKATHYARRLSEAFEIIKNATEETTAHGTWRPGGAKRVTLSINATFMNLWLADRLPRFRELHPDCEIEVSTHDDSGKGGNPRADLRVLFTFGNVTPAQTVLVSLVMFPVCAPKFVSGTNAIRVPADLSRHRLVHENTTAWWENWVAVENVTGIDAKGGAIFHDPTLAMREAVNGGGIALADNIMAQDLIAKGLLVAPFAIRTKIPNCYCLEESQANAQSSYVKKFRNWISIEISKHKKIMQLE